MLGAVPRTTPPRLQHSAHEWPPEDLRALGSSEEGVLQAVNNCASCAGDNEDPSSCSVVHIPAKLDCRMLAEEFL